MSIYALYRVNEARLSYLGLHDHKIILDPRVISLIHHVSPRNRIKFTATKVKPNDEQESVRESVSQVCSCCKNVVIFRCFDVM